MSSIVACDSGASAAPNMPCSRRKPDQLLQRLCRAAHHDATVKPVMQTMNSRLRPKRTAIQPTGAVMMAAAIT